jgi:uncharacterized surface protein with fasciclin (FAS1) repeats
VVDTLLKAGDYGTFLKAIADADLAEILKGPGPFTVFAPSDSVFARMKGKEVQKLLADRERLRRVVRVHVVPGRLSIQDLRKLRNGDRLATLLEGRKLRLGLKKDRVSLERAFLVKPDLEASNGVIHGVDALLSP